MKIIKIKNTDDKTAIKRAAEYLRQGKIIAYPTETVYGLGCDVKDRKAVNKIYKIKGKSEKKALLFLVSGIKMAKEYVVFDKQALKLAKEYWPGALSLILPLTEKGKKIFKRTDGGVRISGNKIATAIVRKLKNPIISTSANLSNQPSALSAKEVEEYFKDKKNKPDLILDAGKLKKSKGSTIVSLINKELRIVRDGDVKIFR